MEINAISTLKFRFSEIKNIPLPFSEILVSKSCRFFSTQTQPSNEKSYWYWNYTWSYQYNYSRQCQIKSNIVHWKSTKTRFKNHEYGNIYLLLDQIHSFPMWLYLQRLIEFRKENSVIEISLTSIANCTISVKILSPFGTIYWISYVLQSVDTFVNIAHFPDYIIEPMVWLDCEPQGDPKESLEASEIAKDNYYRIL